MRRAREKNGCEILTQTIAPVEGHNKARRDWNQSVYPVLALCEGRSPSKSKLSFHAF